MEIAERRGIEGAQLAAVTVAAIMILGIGGWYAYGWYTASHAAVNAGGMWGVAFVKGIDGKTLSVSGGLTPMSQVALGGSVIYDSATGQAGEIGDDIHAAISILNGTASHWSVAGNIVMQFNGQQVSTQAFSQSGSGTPPSSIYMGSITRSGGAVFSDFGSPSVTASGTYTYSVGGTACVTFNGAGGIQCHSFSTANLNTQTLTFNPSGSFTVSTGSNPLVTTVTVTSTSTAAGTCGIFGNQQCATTTFTVTQTTTTTVGGTGQTTVVTVTGTETVTASQNVAVTSTVTSGTTYVYYTTNYIYTTITVVSGTTKTLTTIITNTATSTAVTYSYYCPATGTYVSSPALCPGQYTYSIFSPFFFWPGRSG